MNRRFVLLLAVFAFAAPVVIAAEPDLAAVPANADSIIALRPARLWNHEFCRGVREFCDAQKDEFTGLLGITPDQIERITVASRGDDTFAVIRSLGPIDHKKLLASAWLDGAIERRVAGKVAYRNEQCWAGVVFLDDRTFLAGPIDVVEFAAREKVVTEGPQATAIRSVMRHDIVLSQSGIRRDAFKALEAGLPDAVKEFLPLLRVDSAVIVVDVDDGDRDIAPSVKFRGTATYTTDEAARAAEKATKGLRTWVGKELTRVVADLPEPEAGTNPLQHAERDALTTLKEAWPGVEVQRDGKSVSAAMRMNARDLGSVTFLQAFFSTHTHFAADGGSPSLEAVAKAVRAYEQDKGHLPPHAIYSADGKTPLLSWRVLILQYLGDDAKKLYAQFKLDEPWDSDHNIRLVRKMPKVFAGEEPCSHPTTPFQVVVGPGTLFDGPKGRPLKDATDGADKTLLITHGFHRVPWNKPQDLTYAADKPLPRIGSVLGIFAGTPTAFADGSVRRISPPGNNGEAIRVTWVPVKDYDDKPLRAMITRAGGEAVEVPTEPGLPLPKE